MNTSNKEAAMLASIARRYAENCMEVLAECESPIERLFVAAMIANGWEFDPSRYDGSNGSRQRDWWHRFIGNRRAYRLIDPDAKTSSGDVTILSSHHVYDTVALIQPHLKVNERRMRPDILMVGTCPPYESIVIVELDGHDFHERSKERAAADKSRDRKLQIMGCKALRFTGSEVFADAGLCVREAEHAIEADGDTVLFAERSAQGAS